jgi:hypothetical protein
MSDQLKSGVCHIDTRRGGWVARFALISHTQIDILGTLPQSRTTQHWNLSHPDTSRVCADLGNDDRDQVLNCDWRPGGGGRNVCEPSFAVVIYNGINYTHINHRYLTMLAIRALLNR